MVPGEILCLRRLHFLSFLVTDSINNKVKDNYSWIINGIYCEKGNGAGTGY